MNTELRRNAKKEDFFKLMNNAVYAKTMQMFQQTEISSLKKPKQEEIFCCQNQTIKRQKLFQIIY